MVERTELTDGFVLPRPVQADHFERFWEAAGESFAEVSVWMPWSADLPKEETRGRRQGELAGTAVRGRDVLPVRGARIRERQPVDQSS